ncbi:MAG: hypothetical protein ACR2OM_15445 [Aestuariivirgaceae bacterium]
MNTRQSDIKAGTVDGAADRLAELREASTREGLTPTDPPVDDTPQLAGDIDAPEEEILEAEPPAEEEVDPVDETADLFADDLEEVVETQALDTPAALSSEGKELFAQADPELQKAVADRIAAAERAFTQKSQQLAEERTALETTAQQVLDMRQQLERQLSDTNDLPEPPDPDLADVNSDKYDPDRFNVELARYERAKRSNEVKTAERRKLADENARLAVQKDTQVRQQNANGIAKAFPAWNTEEKFMSGVTQVQDYIATESGISIEAARKITDPTAIKLAYKAKRYDEAKAKAGKKPAPKGAAPTGRQRIQTETNVSKARDRLKETGSVNDAVAVLTATRRKGVNGYSDKCLHDVYRCRSTRGFVRLTVDTNNSS